MEKRRRGPPQKKGNDSGGKNTTWTKSPYRSTQQSKKSKAGGSKSKKSKQTLSFDEDDRQTFLSGFQKRKAERKQLAKEKLDEQVREEVRRIKEKREEKIKKILSDNSVARELNEHAEYALDYDLPEQTVSIIGLDIGNITNSLGICMGVNKPKAECEPEPEKSIKEDASDEEGDVTTTEPQTSESIRDNLKQIKKSHNKALQKSKILKAKQRLKTKKARQVKRFGTKASRKAKARESNSK